MVGTCGNRGDFMGFKNRNMVVKWELNQQKKNKHGDFMGFKHQNMKWG